MYGYKEEQELKLERENKLAKDEDEQCDERLPARATPLPRTMDYTTPFALAPTIGELAKAGAANEIATAALENVEKTP